MSHDREFLNNVVTSTFVLEGDGTVKQFPGGYDDYEAQRKKGAESSSVAKEAGPPKPPPPPPAKDPRKLSYNEKRELESLPGKIDSLEKELAKVREALADGSVFKSDPARAKELGEKLPELEAELESAVDRWAELAERDREGS